MSKKMMLFMVGNLVTNKVFILASSYEEAVEKYLLATPVMDRRGNLIDPPPTPDMTIVSPDSFIY